MNAIEETIDRLETSLGREPTEEEVVESIRVTKFLGIDDKWYIQRKLTPSAQYRRAYILLDTDNVDPNLTSDTQFGWRFMNCPVVQDGTISAVADIRDIVAMRIFPVKTQLLTPVGETGKTYINNVIDLNHNFTILIHEFQSQAYIGKEGRKFHFVLYPQLMNPTITAFRPITPANPYYEYTTSGKGNGWFWFRTPITSINTLTVSMANPFDLVKFDTNVRTLIPIEFTYLRDVNGV